MQNQSVGYSRMGINYKRSQGQNKRAVLLQQVDIKSNTVEILMCGVKCRVALPAQWPYWILPIALLFEYLITSQCLYIISEFTIEVKSHYTLPRTIFHEFTSNTSRHTPGHISNTRSGRIFNIPCNTSKCKRSYQLDLRYGTDPADRNTRASNCRHWELIPGGDYLFLFTSMFYLIKFYLLKF